MAFFKNEDCIIKSEPIVKNSPSPFYQPIYAEVRKPNIKKDSEMKELDITTELWREYDFGGRTYRIDSPVKLFLREGGTTHRVVDSNNIAHCVPAPGEHGCVLRWENKNKTVPVNF